VTTVWRLFRLRSTIFFHPFCGPGGSAIPMSAGIISTITGTPGKAPCMVPEEGCVPSMVNSDSLSSLPDQMMWPDEGPLYAGALAGAGAGAGAATGAGSRYDGGGLRISCLAGLSGASA